MKALQQHALALSGLAVFAALREKPLFAHFLKLCKATDAEERLVHYGDFVAEIYSEGASLADCVQRAVFEDENPYVRTRAGKGSCADLLENAGEQLPVEERKVRLSLRGFEVKTLRVKRA